MKKKKITMKNNNYKGRAMTVAEWMQAAHLSNANKLKHYIVGQPLTEEDAWYINRHIYYSVMLTKNVAPPYELAKDLPALWKEQVEVLACLAWYPGTDDHWAEALLGTLCQDELIMLHDSMHSFFADPRGCSVDITLAEWMGHVGLPKYFEASQIDVGQNLTIDEATLLSQAVLCGVMYENEPERILTEEEACRGFVITMMELMWSPRIAENSNWRLYLWLLLPPDDRAICHQIMRSMHNNKRKIWGQLPARNK